MVNEMLLPISPGHHQTLSQTHPTKPRHRPLWMTAAAWLSQALAVHRLETHFQDLRETFNTPEAQRPAWLWDRNTGNPLLEYGKAMHLAWKKQQVRDKRGSAERAMAKAAAIGITARLAIRGVDRIWTSIKEPWHFFDS